MHDTIVIILTRPGGSQFEVVRPRAGLYTDFFLVAWGKNGLGHGVHKHAQARGVWGHAPPGKF